MPTVQNDNLSVKAKKYCIIKYTLGIVHSLYGAVILFIFAFSGASLTLSAIFAEWIPNPYFLLAVYFLALSAAYYLFNFSFIFYRSFILEHQFSLSRQNIGDWFVDQVKGGGIFYFFTLAALEAFFYLLRNAPQAWWWLVSAVWIFLSLVLAKAAPVVIVPLFFKYKRMAEEPLRQRLLSLAARMGVPVCDVFEIDLSRKSLKANAAFAGLGKTRRIILSDTLKENFSPDEIEVILAHEFAHYRLGHIVKLLVINSFSIVFSFYVLFLVSGPLSVFFRLPSFTSVAVLPVLFLYWMAWGTAVTPFENALSRAFERSADRKALEATGLKDAFINTMEKFSRRNLSDRKPHPLIKLFFFDHPPVDERIAMAHRYRV
ncbi:MAG: M48 family metallopeptidase [Candidatus Omnitrophica bacterium]|nr:M48 family metallopeptidase [Candidatus Omnitrophota bacterium]